MIRAEARRCADRASRAGLLEWTELAMRASGAGSQFIDNVTREWRARQRKVWATEGIDLFPSPEALASAKLTSVGLTSARAETIRALARAVRGGKIKFDGVVDSDEFLGRLSEIPGIGAWTAQYVAMRALGEPDAFPSSDLGLLRALSLGSAREVERRAEPWRPWRAYASMYLWRMAGQRTSQGERKPMREKSDHISQNLDSQGLELR